MIVFIDEREPWHPGHWQCTECDSTWPWQPEFCKYCENTALKNHVPNPDFSIDDLKDAVEKIRNESRLHQKRH